MTCADKVKDKSSVGENMSPSHRAEMESCVTKCGDEMIKLMPTFTKKTEDYFKKGLYNNQ